MSNRSANSTVIMRTTKGEGAPQHVTAACDEPHEDGAGTDVAKQAAANNCLIGCCLMPIIASPHTRVGQ